MHPFKQQAHEVRMRALHVDPQRFLDRYPDDVMALACHISRKMGRCDWKGLDDYIEHLRHIIRTTDQYTEPNIFNLIGTTQEEQYVNATRYTQWRYGKTAKKEKKKRKSSHLRIGYLSSDFHEHATCYLLASLFEHHDKGGFQIYAYSCGTDDNSPMRKRINEGVEHFRNLRTLPIADAIKIVQEDKIDILVDLKGYSMGHCMDIIAGLNDIPIVHYLGYPSTTGGMCDYIIADKVVIPEYNEKWFSEKVIYLPGCYQINDDKCDIAETRLRADYGLPETGNIYASFNQQYKITSSVWSQWMQILRKDPSSVLWQYIQGDEAHEMLKKHAEFYCVDPKRIIKAHHIARPDHLARLRLVYRCFDTQPVSGHTTTSDFLRMGHTPILPDKPTDTFISNVTNSLISNQETLWNAKEKTRHIEAAYLSIINE